MVHALQECWRVLVPDGQLIDMRPRTSKPDVELVFDDAIRTAGQLDDSAADSDDEAADRAIASLVSSGLLARKEERRFSFNYIWQSVAQMQAYLEGTWSAHTYVPPQVVARAHELSAAGGLIHCRLRRVLMMADYRKRPTSGAG
jgi:hypothetical protein